MNYIFDLAKRVPNDIRQAICSLFVSACLITASLLMLGSYLGSIEDGSGDKDVMASAAEQTEDAPEDLDTP